jgi:hypothetical protein
VPERGILAVNGEVAYWHISVEISDTKFTQFELGSVVVSGESCEQELADRRMSQNNQLVFAIVFQINQASTACYELILLYWATLQFTSFRIDDQCLLKLTDLEGFHGSAY